MRTTFKSMDNREKAWVGLEYVVGFNSVLAKELTAKSIDETSWRCVEGHLTRMGDGDTIYYRASQINYYLEYDLWKRTNIMSKGHEILWNNVGEPKLRFHFYL